ncbi:MAG: two-component system response regulator FlrC, partial [bacterium]
GPIHADPLTVTLLDMAKKFAKSNATILLRGESGTGKEVFSNFIHNNSSRKDKPFVSLNCAAIPETLIESELFGHEKGAFSGAIASRKGKFQQADGGTLLLDEISEMDVILQAKLLRAIQERVIDPVGSTKPVHVDIRLIATTNRNLEEEVALGNFREDLYFRLNVVMLDIPALRERPGDIIPLAQYFAGVYGSQNGLEDIKFDQDAIEKLIGCYWKGNVRELENTIHRAVLMMGDDNIMSADHISISPMSQNMASTVADVPVQTDIDKKRALAGAAAGAYANTSGGYEKGMGATEPSASDMVGRTVQEMEEQLILSTLNYCKGNRTHAADILGISIRTLRNKLKEYNDKQTQPKQAESA